MWGAVLGVDGVGASDRFIDLGGHSLLAGRIAASVVERFGVTLSMAVLLETPTVGDMAIAVTERLVARAAAANRDGLRQALGDEG
jgi:acyl carrier protein